MQIAGLLQNEKEKAEVLYVLKLFLVGQRAQILSRLQKLEVINENNNKKKNK